MKKIVKLTETDLTRLVKRTINEMEDEMENEMDDMDETMSLENIYDEFEYTKKEFDKDFSDFAYEYIRRLEFLIGKIDELSDEEYKESDELEREINIFYHKIGDLYYLD
jgi:hypothetical protein